MTIQDKSILTSESALNVFKNQIIINKTNTGSLRIKKQKVFDKNRTTLFTKSLDDQTAITLLKTHFNPNGLNSVLIEDEVFFRNIEKVYFQHFANNDKFKIIRCKKILEDITDEEKLAEIIRKEHLRNNHRGIEEVFTQLKQNYYNPKLKERITQFTNNCDVCNCEKYVRNPPKPMFKITDTPRRPKEIIHVDVFYTLQNQLFLTIIDIFSKHACAIKLLGRTWTEFKRALCYYFGQFGLVQKIVVDNELGFKAIPLRQFLKTSGVDIHFVSNSNHTSNADIERLHNTINEHIRLLKHDKERNEGTVEEKILQIIVYYNNTIHSTTNKKPIDFVNGKVHEAEYEGIYERMLAKKQKAINKLNKDRQNNTIEDGKNFIKEVRGGKNYSKYRKIDSKKIDEDHVIDTKNQLKYYRAHIKPKKKFQNIDKPTIKVKVKRKGGIK